MEFVAEIFNSSSFRVKNHRRVVIWKLAFWFRINSNEFKVFPHPLQQIIKVPFMMSRNRDAMRYFIDKVQLFNGNLINLVQQVDARNVDTISFNDINQIISSCVVSQSDVSIVNPVLRQDLFYRV